MNKYRTIFRPALALALLVAPIYAGSDSNTRYLALGDSVSFGYYPSPPPPAAQPPIQSYVGYPEILDPSVPKQEVNLSCPGQTSGSFLTGKGDTEVPGANCEYISSTYPGWKASLPLHISPTYFGISQADFAVSELLANKSIDLVTISIGGNDLSKLQADCFTLHKKAFVKCVVDNSPGTLGTYATNLATILTAIRGDALSGYRGTLVMVKYYPVNTDPTFTTAIAALNNVMVQVGSNFGVKFADGFTAFQVASFWTRGDPCKAGLLVRLGPDTCDIHPSRLGQSVLAITVLAAIAGR